MGESAMDRSSLQRFANSSRPTLRKVESGDPTVSLETFLNVLRALGRLDSVVGALDPYETEFGRAR